LQTFVCLIDIPNIRIWSRWTCIKWLLSCNNHEDRRSVSMWAETTFVRERMRYRSKFSTSVHK